MKKEWVDLLIKSFDDQLTDAEAGELAQALAQSPELQKEQADLLKMRQLIGNFSIKKNELFVDNIMDAIERETIVAKQRITYYLSAIYPKAVAACLVILMGFVTYLYLSEGNLDTETLVGITDLSPDEAYSFLAEE